MKKKWKIILGSLAAVVIVLAGISQASKGIETRTMLVKPESIAKTFKEKGSVTSEQEAKVYAPLNGKIIEVPVKEGQLIQKGDILTYFDTQGLVCQKEQLDGQLKSIKAQQQTEVSNTVLEKKKQLYEAGAISQQEYEDAKNKLDSAYYQGQIESLEAQIKAIQYQIGESVIKAEQNGVVSQLSVKKGTVVVSGTPLMNIFSAGNYQIEVFVLTEDVARISNGMEVTLLQENKSGDIVFKGTVQKIAPSAVEMASALGLKEQRVKVTVQPQVPEDLVLKPGFALDAEFTIDKQERKLVVPKTALFSYNSEDVVWIIENGKAKVQKIKKDFENDSDVVITEGLKEGDRIILNPQTAGLKEGVKIKG
ncbi:MAG TPA: efflux RND transporter periplasmic adaptor subunit [Desulfitobacteriaceae bacterium]|nr:efflux RND transporter periplasmic adaptor subunit [Desulfitobacteriaceae bacterium]